MSDAVMLLYKPVNFKTNSHCVYSRYAICIHKTYVAYIERFFAFHVIKNIFLYFDYCSLKYAYLIANEIL